jgi:biopolymer transport protein ExbD
MNIDRSLSTAEAPQLDLTPLVDTIFLLIIFFVFAIPNAMMPLGVKINLPETPGSERVERARLEITVTAEDKIFVGPDQTSLPELCGRLERFAASGGQAVSIRGDVSSTLGRVLSVYGACKSAGISKISVLTGMETSGGQGR